MTDAVERLSSALSEHYRLERELGQGGMATVYLAHDLKHDRRVALKVLRPELAAAIGADRFLAEIRTTANLQHPHILPLFDSGRTGGPAGGRQSEDFLFYVMPYVEGESLRDRLTREKQLPIADAVRIATEIASALDYAHRHGVIHRDIKPENILLHDGRALVADFGIALAASKAGGSRMTETGMSLGTPHYMSPEQAMGERELDARSDVYALGATLYELLTGEPPFTGPTAQAIIAKVMTSTPEPVTTLRKTVPPHVAGAVHQAIQKLPADRFPSAAAFGAALVGDGRTTATVSIPVAARRPVSRVSAALVVISLGLLGLAAWAFTRHPRASGPVVFDAVLPDTAPMTFAAATATYGAPIRNISISADGGFAVYVARQGDSTALWYRSLRDATSRPIGGTTGATAPRISPDDARVAFLVGDRVIVVPVAGGEPRRLFAGRATESLNWISPTQLIAVDGDGYRFSWLDPEGGAVRSKAIPRCTFGYWLAEVRQLLCTYHRTARLVDPETDERWAIRARQPDGSPGNLLIGSTFRIVQQRYVLYLSTGGSLLAASYDPATHLAGRSVTLVAGIRREADGEGQYDIGANGMLVYSPGLDATVGRFVSLHAGGTPQPLPLEMADFQRYDLSRDRRWLAAAVQAADGAEVRIYDLRNGQHFTWLTGEMLRHPLWTPDGEHLLLSALDSTRWSILRGAPSSGRQPDTVAAFDGLEIGPDPIDIHDEQSALAMDGAIAMRFNPGTARAKFDTVLTSVRFTSVSPNGKLVSYQTLEGGRIEVTTFPSPGRRWQLASEGVEPLWLSAREVLFRLGVGWYVVRINPETGEPLGAPTVWGRDPRFSDTFGWSNRLSHDGGIIYLQGPAQTGSNYLRAVPDWVPQMRAAVDAANR